MPMRLGSAILCLAAVAASPAAAQDGDARTLPERVLVILNGTSSAEAAHQQMALVEVGNVLRERSMDFHVVGTHECTETSNGCLRLRGEHDADAVVIVSVYRGDPGSVDLQLFDASNSGEGTQSWLGDPSTAAGQAMQKAIDSFAPESVRVEISGSPDGATVWFGRRTGHLPFVGTVSPGTHRLRVSAGGFRTHAETVEVPASGETWRHRITLREGTDGPVTLSGDGSGADSGNAVPTHRPLLLGLGASSAILGLGGIVAGALALASHGCEEPGCARDPDDPAMVRRNETTGVGIGLTAAGVLLIAAGVALTIAGLRLEPTVSRSGAALRFTHHF